MAYGERQTLTYSLDVLSSIICPKTQQIFDVIFRIYALDIVLKDLGFFMSYGVVNAHAAKIAQDTFTQLIKTLAVFTPDIIESMNVPTHALYTPIAGDYIKFNESPNYGEVVNAKL